MTKPGDELVITTERLVVRDFRELDTSEVHALRSDPKVKRCMDFDPESLAESQKWLEGVILHNRLRPRSAYDLAITRRDEDRVIGWTGFGDSERHPSPGNVGVGYVLSSRHWGRGYVTEALRAVIAYTFDILGGEYIFAWCLAENSASERVMQKAGMSLVRRYEHETSKTGHSRHCLEYGLSREVWQDTTASSNRT